MPSQRQRGKDGPACCGNAVAVLLLLELVEVPLLPGVRLLQSELRLELVVEIRLLTSFKANCLKLQQSTMLSCLCTTSQTHANVHHGF
eukprot:scaffold167502_cov13-Tisochrysis_lutea.AAC.1